MEGQGLYAQRIGEGRRRRKWKYDGWVRGQNSFSEANEVRDDEFPFGLNIELTGRSSVRLGRRGRRTFTTITGKTSFNGWGILKDTTTSTNLLIVQIDGELYKVDTSGNVTEIDGSFSRDTDALMRGIQFRGSFYFGNATDYMAKTDGSTVSEWTAITAVSGVTGSKTGSSTDKNYAYVVTAVTDLGETESSSEWETTNASTLDSSNYNTPEWNRKTDSDVVGYNIYRSDNGDTLYFLAFVKQESSGATLTYDDDGVESRSLIYESPSYNTTGGVKGNIFATYSNTLFIAGNPTEVDSVFIGGTGSNYESFSPSYNGGWIKPGRGSGQEVTAMIGFDDFLVIFMDNSIWRFEFASDGSPTLSSIIPQYGTMVPDSVKRMENDVIFYANDGRYRVLGYEPTQLNVIRTTDLSNRIQPDLDAIDKTNADEFHAVFFEQKYIFCNKEKSFPYDRRYLGFLGTWDNQDYDRMIVWDKGTNSDLLFGIQSGTGIIFQALVDNTWDDDGTAIGVQFKPKTQDGGEDTILKYFFETRFKLKDPRGQMTFITYKDGTVSLDTSNISFDLLGGIGEYMWDEPMFDESISITTTPDALQIIKKEIFLEAYSIYHQINLNANEYNHAIIQTMNGTYEYEDIDYDRDEKII